MMRIKLSTLCNFYNVLNVKKIPINKTIKTRSLFTNSINYELSKPNESTVIVPAVNNPTKGQEAAVVTTHSVKKRPLRRRCVVMSTEGTHMVTAFATAEQYDLEKLIDGLKKQNLYEAQRFLSSANYACSPDVIHATAKFQVGNEPRNIFFFREGCMVLWNVTDLESSNLMSFIKEFEEDSYSDAMVEEESEQMTYYTSDKGGRAQIKDNMFVLSNSNPEESLLEKYTYSNAMALSVKLGIWEASLDQYIGSIDHLTWDLKRGKKIRLTRDEMLRKTGELFALRHTMNLRSDLLDVPDFYWDRDQMERLYTQTSNYFSISKRTKVQNEKLNHCVELADLISSHLNDRHHIRLEWMVIVLILVEVLFEVLHYADRIIG
ncbi:required for meiotic nuclear division protein 1 homolog [Ctenocephalides felis]|uniref:required for meiotic nuclear division protein 1 homolog n=1 Tax=Ctenocephalides felis TaxID=7515 RepID=UPI000E6E283A|nr:required for meiotic nuclear division protein 1 homolog [Ctenocephalides felis]